MRLQTRPTWLAVTVAAFTGYCVGHPEPIVGAFREDGLPFFMVAAVIVGVAIHFWREERAERRAARQMNEYASRLERNRRSS